MFKLSIKNDAFEHYGQFSGAGAGSEIKLEQRPEIEAELTL